MRLIFLAAAALLAPLPAAAQSSAAPPATAQPAPAAAPAAAEVPPAWYRLRLAGGDTRTYINLASIHREGEMLVADNISTVLRPGGVNGISAIEGTMEYDCAERRGHFLRITAYDADHEIVATMGSEGGWQRASPGTDAFNSIDFVCGVNRDGAVPVADPWSDPSNPS